MSESLGTAWWPNQSFRDGDFSALLAPASIPRPGLLPFADRHLRPGYRSGFPNNRIPASRLHRGAERH